MSRVRELSRHTAWFQALALLFVSGCIFSPEEVVVPPPKPIVIDSPEKVIAALSQAYQTRNPDLLASLLAHDPDRNANYLFYLSDPTPQGEDQWGYEEEVRIHRRMFKPEDPLPGEGPVPTELWLESVEIHLTAQRTFQERIDLYSTNGGVDGKLDPSIWKATDATYGTDVLFNTQSDTDYQVTGQANFVVIEDKTKHVGDAGKFLIYVWEDVKPAKPQAEKRPT